jgi:TPR repeat protein
MSTASQPGSGREEGNPMTKPYIILALGLAAAVGLGACASTPRPVDADRAAAFEQARQAYLAQDYPRALRLMLRQARLGNPHAQYTLGYMYYYGQGVRQDTEQALAWIRQAAAQGDARAVQALGELAAAGLRPVDPANAKPAE